MKGAATNSSEAKQTMMNQRERGLRKEEEEEWQELESSAVNGVDRWFSTVQIYDITVGDWSRPHASPFLNLLLFFSIFMFCFQFATSFVGINKKDLNKYELIAWSANHMHHLSGIFGKILADESLEWHNRKQNRKSSDLPIEIEIEI